jgi:hypothetical protein
MEAKRKRWNKLWPKWPNITSDLVREKVIDAFKVTADFIY